MVDDSPAVRAQLGDERRKWYPVLEWIATLVEDRTEKGRQVVLESPWNTLFWESSFCQSGSFRGGPVFSGGLVQVLRPPHGVPTDQRSFGAPLL